MLIWNLNYGKMDPKEVQRRLDEYPHAMHQRRETVEHPFGTIKMRMGATHLLMKRLKNVKTEMALSGSPTDLAYSSRNRTSSSRNCAALVNRTVPSPTSAAESRLPWVSSIIRVSSARVSKRSSA